MSIIWIPLLLLLHQSYGFPLLQTFSTTTGRNLLRFKRVVRYFGVRHPHSTNSTASFQSCKLWPPMYTRTQDPSQQREVLRGVSQFPPYLFIRMCVVFQTSSLLCTPWHQNYTKSMPLRSLIPTWLSVRTSEPQHGLSGSIWLRKGRPTHGGGVVCTVGEELYPLRSADQEASDSEMLVVQLNTVPAVFIAVCYCKPAQTRTSWREQCQLFMRPSCDIRPDA